MEQGLSLRKFVFYAAMLPLTQVLLFGHAAGGRFGAETDQMVARGAVLGMLPLLAALTVRCDLTVRVASAPEIRGGLLKMFGPHLAMGSAQLAVGWLIAAGFGVPASRVVFAVLVAIPYLVFNIFAGWAIGTAAADSTAALRVAAMLAIPEGLLGGFVFNVDTMPGVMRGFGAYLPVAPLTAAFRRLADVGGSLSNVVPWVSFGVASALLWGLILVSASWVVGRRVKRASE